MNVEEILSEMLSPFPQDLGAQLYDKFYTQYNTPLVFEIEAAVHHNMTVESCRLLQFTPTFKQYAMYVILIQSAPHGAPEDHYQHKIQRIFLPIFYLRHAQNWPLVSEFIVHGGLHVLVEMFTHNDFHIRSQVLESFVQVSDHLKILFCRKKCIFLDEIFIKNNLIDNFESRF